MSDAIPWAARLVALWGEKASKEYSAMRVRRGQVRFTWGLSARQKKNSASRKLDPPCHSPAMNIARHYRAATPALSSKTERLHGPPPLRASQALAYCQSACVSVVDTLASAASARASIPSIARRAGLVAQHIRSQLHLGQQTSQFSGLLLRKRVIEPESPCHLAAGRELELSRRSPYGQ